MTVNEQIKTWIDKIPNSFSIKTITDNGDNTSTLEVCNTGWTLIGHNITIDSVKHEVISVIRDESITIEGVPTVKEFALDIPFFSYGTPKQTDIEREILRTEGTIVTPMIYLFASIREDENHNPKSPIHKTVNFVISFLNDYENNDFTDDIIDYSVKAMRNLTDSFIVTMKKQIQEVIPESLTQSTREYPKYAQNFTKSGGVSNIFSENLSGVENNLTISLKYQRNCVNLCNS